MEHIGFCGSHTLLNIEIAFASKDVKRPALEHPKAGLVT